MHEANRVRGLLLGALLAVIPFAAPALAATPEPLVTVKVSLGQTVGNLLAGRFAVQGTCVRACNAKATIYIRSALALKLGFSGVKLGHPVGVGSKSVRLAAGKPTTILIPLNSQAKRLLLKLKADLQVQGQLNATSVTNSSRRGTASWITTLRK